MYIYEEALVAYKSKNYVIAFEKFQAAARLGIPDAHLKLGFMYANGIGTIQDHAESIRWYQSANEARRSLEDHDVFKEIQSGNFYHKENQENPTAAEYIVVEKIENKYEDGFSLEDGRLSHGKIYWLIAILILIVMMAASYIGKGVVWELINGEGWAKSIRWTPIDGRSAERKSIDGTLDAWRDKAENNVGLCVSGIYAGPEDIRSFEQASNAYLEKLVNIKREIEEHKITKSKARENLRPLSIEAAALGKFYNSNLVRCYLSSATARDISKRINSVNIGYAEVVELTK